MLRIFGLTVLFGIVGIAVLAVLVLHFIRRRKGAAGEPPPPAE